MRFVYFTKLLRGQDIPGIIAFLKDVGVDGADLAVRPGYPVTPDNAAAELPKAAKAFRDAGLVIGLLLLTPVFVNDINAAPNKAIPAVAISVYGSPLPKAVKNDVATQLLKVYKQTPQAQLPDLGPPFAAVAAQDHLTPADARTLAKVQASVHADVERAGTTAFHRALRYSSLFALAVLPVLALGLMGERSRRRTAPDRA